MIVYMIMDNKTGNWFNFDRSWYIMQESGSVWTNEEDANAMLRAIDKPNNAVKMRFALAPAIAGLVWPECVVVDGETWTFCPDLDTWLWGHENDGCGIQSCLALGGWTANVVFDGDLCLCGEGYLTRDEAMIAAVAYWRKNNNGK